MFELEENSEVRAFSLPSALTRKRESEREMEELDLNSGLRAGPWTNILPHRAQSL